jgi:hypothetical protein
LIQLPPFSQYTQEAIGKNQLHYGNYLNKCPLKSGDNKISGVQIFNDPTRGNIFVNKESLIHGQ